MPLVRFATTQLPAAPVTVHVFVLFSTAVTVYELGGPPPEPRATVTVAWAFPAVAVGVPGTAGGNAPLVITPLVPPLERPTATKRPLA